MKISEVEANGKIEEGLKNRENIQQRRRSRRMSLSSLQSRIFLSDSVGGRERHLDRKFDSSLLEPYDQKDEALSKHTSIRYINIGRVSHILLEVGRVQRLLEEALEAELSSNDELLLVLDRVRLRRNGSGVAGCIRQIFVDVLSQVLRAYSVYLGCPYDWSSLKQWHGRHLKSGYP
ncbi:uncharacterized protein LOC119287795 [Triticum dicoccoides]|uniref:uncharacterized protein LOC119287795 n=1 Tax=Triticum dicoccoides TaxID=85692 RepID=UPI000E79BF6D|nr:uncharacterized protein LOC119287795 [Triticum dicoccoides]